MAFVLEERVEVVGTRTVAAEEEVDPAEGAKEDNDAVVRYNALLEALFASGRVKTQEYKEVETGFEAAIKALNHKGDGRKVVVKI